VEQLVNPDVTVKDIALGQRVGSLEIQRRQHLPCHHGARKVRRAVPGDLPIRRGG